MDEGFRFACGWRDIRSCEWPRVRNIFDTAVDVEYGGQWDIRSYGGPAIRSDPEFVIMDVVGVMDLVLGHRPGSCHVDSERIQ